MSSFTSRTTAAAVAGDLQVVTVPASGKPPLPPSSAKPSSNALVEYNPSTANVLEDEDLEIKLRRILEGVPVRVSNTSGSSAGSGSGDFHQYRQMRRKEQDRLARMEVDYQKRKETVEFHMRREERLKAAEERTAKKRLKRQKKKQRKKGRKNESSTSGAGDEDDRRQSGESSSSDDDDRAN
ncbi:OLC1v1007839C1 [Oldenlandia corymbosa var. corymbosa]|uniref:OLC1v1007839C1 n=1 Tax=Oldenlandia corymbosa var. corymbosa TaxID=529605 RepID=A0AAV1DML8_OLDCO|nr:OLC1v1007839C1 [Oldenlandia corymbosa var. corymbosa]